MSLGLDCLNIHITIRRIIRGIQGFSEILTPTASLIALSCSGASMSFIPSFSKGAQHSQISPQCPEVPMNNETNAPHTSILPIPLPLFIFLRSTDQVVSQLFNIKSMRADMRFCTLHCCNSKPRAVPGSWYDSLGIYRIDK